MVVVNEKKCVGCGICACICPVNALEGYGTIRLNREVCTECLECTQACPVDALEVKS